MKCHPRLLMTPSSCSVKAFVGLVKLNEAACLKVDIRSFQVVTDRLAKLVSYPNSFPDQQ